MPDRAASGERDVWTLPKLDGAHLTLGLAVLYALGFIVANVHFGRYELLRLELIRARYVAAALAFIACSAIPFGAGIFLSLALRSRAGVGDALDATLKLGETVLWSMGPVRVLLLSFGVMLAYTSVLAAVSLRPGDNLWNEILYFVPAFLGALFTWDTFVGGSAADIEQTWPAGRLLRRLTYVCGLGLLLPAIFGQLIYGSVRSEFGGGAAWLGQVRWSDSTTARVSDLPLDSVAIIERDDQAISLLACSRRGKVERISVPVGSISELRLAHEIVPDRFSCPPSGAPTRP